MSLDLVFVTFVDLTGESGQNLYSKAIANTLAERDDVSLHVVCPEPEKSLSEEFRARPSSITFLKKKRKKSIQWQIQVQYSLWQSLHEFDSNEIDGIVTTLKSASFTLPLISMRISVPMVLLVEGLLSKNIEKIYPIPGVKLAGDTIAMMNASRSRHIFTAYQEAKEWIQSLPLVNDDKVSVFSHGVDTELFRPIDEKIARGNTGIELSADVVISYVGSFKKYHCLDLLLRVIDRLLQMNIDVHLLLLGDGPEYNHIKEQVDTLDINDNVTFTGFVEQEMVPAYISISDIAWGVIDPDHWGSPMKVFEYLSCSCPVIAHESSELEFIKEIESGYLLSDLSEDNIIRVINSLIELDEKTVNRMGESGRKYIRSNRIWSALGDQIISEFETENRR